MKRALAVFCVLVSTALSASSEPEEKWEGFRRAEDVRPTFLPFLRDSVVIIETAGAFLGRQPSDQPDQWVDTSKVKPDKGKKLIKDRRKFQIETCRRAGLRKCPIMKRTTYATGFILDGDTLYMCRHGFHNWLAWASARNGKSIKDVVIPLRIRTVSGRLLYDSSRARPNEQLRLHFLNGDIRLNRPIDTAQSFPSAELAFNAKASELAVLKSPKVFGAINAPPKKTTALGDQAYLFGFPDPVKNYEGGKVSGKEIAGSHGYALDVISERGTLRFSNYSNVGMSGAPVMSPNGEILGMSCGSFGLEDKVTSPSNVNATAITLDTEQTEKLWRGLTYP